MAHHRNPSVKTIETRLGLERKQALALRKLLDGRADPESYPGVEKWVRRCYHRPSETELIMAAADELLEGHGVEALEGDYVDSYHQNIAFTYVNMGDPYVTTLVHDSAREQFLVCCWGDIAERMPSTEARRT